MASRSSLSVALVGRRPKGIENLALTYLKTALDEARIEAAVIRLNHVRDISRAADAIMEKKVGLVGLALPDAPSAFLALALGEMLKRRRYRGTVICGGTFATLARHWLLQRYDWLAGVVRFAGERTLVRIAEKLVSARPLTDIPGFTTREGDGEAAPVSDSTTLSRPSRRDEDLPERMGVPVVSILSARGCEGTCLYCGPASLQEQEREEAQRLGLTSKECRKLGIGGIRRRDLSNLCDEIAHLFHKRGVRYFSFANEHLLPFEESEALDFLERWQRELEVRRVDKFHYSAMMRTDQLTDALARKLVETGLTRVLLGVDMVSESDSAVFSRPVCGACHFRAVEVLHDNGVSTIANVMVLHPYSTVDSIRSAIDSARLLPHHMVEHERVLVYQGTRLQRRLETEGRLLGNPLRFEYAIDDPAVRTFTQFFTKLRNEVFGLYSVGLKAHDLAFDSVLGRRLYPHLDFGAADAHVESLCRDVRALYYDAYSRALDAAQKGATLRDSEALFDTYRHRAAFLGKRIADVEAMLQRLVKTPLRRGNTFRIASSSVFALMMAAACKNVQPSEDVDGAADSDSATQMDTASDTASCDAEEIESEATALAESIQASEPCFEGWMYVDETDPSESQVGYSLEGEYLEVVAPGAAGAAMCEEAKEIFDAADPTCKSQLGTISITSDAAEQQLSDMETALETSCTYEALDDGFFLELESNVIAVNDDGTVASVTAQCEDDADAAACEEAASCIESALQGLTFSCLFGMELAHSEEVALI